MAASPGVTQTGAVEWDTWARFQGNSAARKGSEKSVLSFGRLLGRRLGAARGLSTQTPSEANVSRPQPLCPRRLQRAALVLGAARRTPSLSLQPPASERPVMNLRLAAQFSLCAPQLRAGEIQEGAARREPPSPTAQDSRYRSSGESFTH